MDIEMLSVDEVQDLLGISNTCLNDLLWSGKIPSIKLGRRRLIPRHALEQFIESQLNDNKSGVA
ncbi:MAG: helix-turn-helix domain-containing protein [Planctomycetota bacterium]